MVSLIPNPKILDKEEGKILKLAHSFFSILMRKSTLIGLKIRNLEFGKPYGEQYKLCT